MKSSINILIFSAITSLFIIGFNSGSNSYNYIFLLPLFVLVLSLLFKHRLKMYENSIVYYLILVQIFFRYVVLPVFISNGDILQTGTNTIYGGETIFFMIIELLIVFFVLIVNSKRQKTNFENRREISVFMSSTIALYLILTVCFIYIYLSGYFSNVSYIWELGAYIENKSDLRETSSLAAVLFYSIRIILSLLLFSLVYGSNLKKKTKLFYITIIIIFNGLFILGTSRFSIIFTVLPFLFITYIIYNDIKTYIIVGSIVLLVPVIIITTMEKYSLGSTSNDYDSIIDSKSINAYFSGPGNISTGLKLYYDKEPWPSFQFLYNDLFQNIPAISVYTEDQYKTNILFNESVYGHRLYQDQIVPLSLNGLIHFGLLGVGFYTFLFLWLALSFERKFYKSIYIGYKFVFATLAISLSLVFMLNMGSLIAVIFRNLIFLLIPLFVIKTGGKLLKR